MNAALKENLAEVSDKLLVELLAEVIDFAEFLREKERRKQAETKQKKSACSVCIKVRAGSATTLTTNWATNFGSAKISE